MKRIIAALAGLAVFALAAPAVAANSNAHSGWQHNPRNPHYVRLLPMPRPTTTCTWVITGTIGSVPHLVCVTR